MYFFFFNSFLFCVICLLLFFGQWIIKVDVWWMPNTELLIYLADSDLDIDISPYYFVSENVAIGPIVKQNV